MIILKKQITVQVDGWNIIIYKWQVKVQVDEQIIIKRQIKVQLEGKSRWIYLIKQVKLYSCISRWTGHNIRQVNVQVDRLIIIKYS